MMRTTIFSLSLLAAMVCGSTRVWAQADERIRPADVLAITVTDQASLTGKYTVDEEGTLRFPLIGRVPAAGLTVEALRGDIRRRLEAGFLADPQVRIVVERRRRVFVFGGVGAPGMYELTETTTLIEVLARSGYGTAAEAVIIRNEQAKAPALPENSDAARVIRVNLREFEKDLQSGKLSRNVVLEDGDTIFVPRGDPNRIYVSGQVRAPGAYSIATGTTVLQALTLAGGPTERASLGRVRIVRIVDGQQKTVDAEVEDVVQPGDTIVVPERFF
jgi:polysaccharide export outer membrane protein